MGCLENDILLDNIRDMYDELEALHGELSYLDSENKLLEAADVYNEILKLNKKIDELTEYLYNLSR